MDDAVNLEIELSPSEAEREEGARKEGREVSEESRRERTKGTKSRTHSPLQRLWRVVAVTCRRCSLNVWRARKPLTTVKEKEKETRQSQDASKAGERRKDSPLWILTTDCLVSRNLLL